MQCLWGETHPESCRFLTQRVLGLLDAEKFVAISAEELARLATQAGEMQRKTEPHGVHAASVREVKQ